MEKDQPSPKTRHETGMYLIMSAVHIDESLAEMLKTEVSLFKKSSKDDNSLEDLTKLNSLLKNIINILILTSDKIETGIELMNPDKCKHDDYEEE